MKYLARFAGGVALLLIGAGGALAQTSVADQIGRAAEEAAERSGTAEPAFPVDPLNFAGRAQSVVSPGVKNGNYAIQAADVFYSSGGLELAWPVLSASHRDGSVTAASLTMSDPSFMPWLLQAVRGEYCLADDLQLVTDFSFQDLAFNPDANAASRSGPPERFKFTSGEGKLSVSGCDLTAEIRGAGLRASGASESVFAISSARIELSLRGGEDPKFSIRLEAGSSHLEQSFMPSGFDVAQWGASVTLSAAQLETIQHLLRKGEPGTFIRMMSPGGASAGLWFSGLDMPLERFLPPQEITRLGLAGIDRITGNAQFAVNAGGGQMTIKGELDLPKLVKSKGDLVLLDGSSSDGFALPAAIAARAPVPQELLALQLGGIRFSFHDLGIGAVAERLTGELPADKAERNFAGLMLKVREKAPSGFAEVAQQSVDGLISILRLGGGFEATPEEPVSLMAFAMRAMTMPGGLEALIGFKKTPR